MFEEPWLGLYYFDSQAFAPSAPDVDRFQQAALYTLQHRLARNPEFAGCLEHESDFATVSHASRARVYLDAYPGEALLSASPVATAGLDSPVRNIIAMLVKVPNSGTPFRAGGAV